MIEIAQDIYSASVMQDIQTSVVMQDIYSCLVKLLHIKDGVEYYGYNDEVYGYDDERYGYLTGEKEYV